jgi:GT2 family glycosyltransferase
MQLFEQDPKLDMVYGNAIMLGDPKQCEFMEKCPSAGSPTFAAMVVEQCQISLSTVVARKPALVDAGLFDEKLLRCDDYDMWLRVAFRGAKIAYTRNVQARLNGGRPGSLGQSRAKMAEGYWIILEKAIRSLPLSTSEQALVRNRAAVIRTRFLMEEGKSCLGQGRFDKAKELFAEANQDLRKNKIRLTVLGLSIAPKMTSKLFFLWTRMRDGAPA